MNKPVVILRTVSVEKMSPVLEACRERWSGAQLWVVSSSGRAEEMRRDIRVARVVDNGVGGFDCPVELDTEAIAVVVPTANEFGGGYGNVLNSSLGIEAECYALCSRCRDLRELGPRAFRWKYLFETCLGRFARLFSGFWAERLLANC